MHGRSGLDVLKEIRTSASKVPVLVLSGHPEEQYAVRVLKAGAAGYLVKESAPQELCRAVRRVLSGGKYITPSLAEQLAAQVQSSNRPAHEALSNRDKAPRLLLNPQNPILCGFGNTKFDHGLGWNLDLLLRLWIKTRTRFPLLLHQLAETGQDKFAGLFNLFVGNRAERIQEYSRGSFVGLGGFGKCTLEFGLGHFVAVGYARNR